MFDIKTHMIKSWSDFEKLVEYSKTVPSEYFFLDCETDSRFEKLARLYGISFCFNDQRAFYLPFRHRPVNKNSVGDLWWTLEQEKDISSWIYNTCNTKKWINHNAIYDILVIENNLGIDLSQSLYSDTILLKHSVDEEKPFGLKEVAVRELGPGADLAQQEMKQSVLDYGGKFNKDDKDMFLADTDILGKYAMWDVIITCKLFKLYQEKLQAEGLEKLFYEDEVMPLYREVTIPMKRYGFNIDIPHFEKLRSEIVEEIEQLERTLYNEVVPQVLPYIQELLDQEVPVKNTGIFPTAVAENLDIPLPLTKKTDKNTGEVTYRTTLSKPAILKQKENNPEYSWFYDWVAGLRTDLDLDSLALYAIQRQLFIQRNPDKPYIFNLGSGQDLAHYFFKVKRYTPLSKTRKGQDQINADFLNHLISEFNDETAEKLIDLKKLEKLKSTYIEGMLELQVDGVLRTSMLQFGTTSGRYSSTSPNCLSMDTQVLTDTGWKFPRQLTYSDKVFQYTEAGTLEQVHPENIYISEEGYRPIVSVKNQHLDMKMTTDHRVVFRDRKSKKLVIKPANEFLRDSTILHSGKYLGGTFTMDQNLMALIVAVQADAETSGKIFRFRFSKTRKYDRLLSILDSLKDKYTFEVKTRPYAKLEVKIYGLYDNVMEYLGPGKTFSHKFLNLEESQRKLFIEELFYWDGSFTRKNNYSTNNETNVDIVQALSALSGIRAHKRIYKTIADNDNFQIDFTRRDYSMTANSVVETKEEFGRVWCLKVPSGMFLVRRGSDTFITGNCQNLPSIKDEESGLTPRVLKFANAIRKGMIAPPGYKIVNADFSQLEVACFAHMSGSSDLQRVFSNKEDLYSKIAIDINKLGDTYSADKASPNYLKKHKPELRNQSKVFCLAVVYGAEESRISQALKIDYKEASRLIKAYLDSYPDLKKYMHSQDYQAKSKGYVSTQFGRKRHLNHIKELYDKYGNDIMDYRWAAAKNLTQERKDFKGGLNNAKNFPIQGLAAHIVNRAAIAIMREFKNRGLDASIRLQVHDELTVIAREDQAEEVRQIMKHCMENTTKLSVPLNADPLIADNWAEAK